jgi:hypothetical protein
MILNNVERCGLNSSPDRDHCRTTINTVRIVGSHKTLGEYWLLKEESSMELVMLSMNVHGLLGGGGGGLRKLGEGRETEKTPGFP